MYEQIIAIIIPYFVPTHTPLELNQNSNVLLHTIVRLHAPLYLHFSSLPVLFLLVPDQRF